MGLKNFITNQKRIWNESKVRLVQPNSKIVSKSGEGFALGAIQDSKVDVGKLPRHVSFLRNPIIGMSRLSIFNTRSASDLFALREMGKTHWIEKYKNVIKSSLLKAEKQLVANDGFKLPGGSGDGVVVNSVKCDKIRRLMENPNSNTTWTDLVSMFVDDSIDFDDVVWVKVFGKSVIKRVGKVAKAMKLDVPGLIKETGYKPEIFTKTYSNPYYEDIDSIVSKVREEDGVTISDEASLRKPSITINKAIPGHDLDVVQIVPVDPVTMIKWPDEFGQFPDDRPVYFQYSLLGDGGSPLPFFNREVVWLSTNTTTYGFYGKSPLVSLIPIVKGAGNAVRDNAQYYEENILPKAIISFLNANKEELEKNVRNMIKMFVGHSQKAMFTNKQVGVDMLRPNNKEMDWLDGLRYYDTQISQTLGVPREMIGDTGDSNLNVSRTMRLNYFENTIKPKLDKLEEAWNVFIIPEFYRDTGVPEVRLKFNYVDILEEMNLHEDQRQDIASGVLNANEVRKERGLDEVDGLDEFKNPNQPVNSFAFNNGDQKAEKSVKKSLKKKSRLGSDIAPIEREADSYEDLLFSYYGDIFKNVDEAVGNIKGRDVNSFVSEISKEFNTLPLRSDIEKQFGFLSDSSLDSVERELDVNLVDRPDISGFVNSLADQQLNGYSIGASVWQGLKGVNAEISDRVGKAVIDGVNLGESIPELRKRVQLVHEFSKNRATNIARTESVRVMNLSRLAFATSSDVPLKKVWLTAEDERVCPICMPLNGKTVGLGDDFESVVKGVDYVSLTPPIHPQDRCTIIFERID